MGIVDIIGEVGYQCRSRSQALEPIPEEGWNPDQAVMIRPAQYMLFQSALAGRALPGIIENQPDFAHGDGKVLGHHPVALPGLDRPGEDEGEINFPESLKEG
jgi:hypothetical protein